MIQSFSGTHPFRPQCLREVVDRDIYDYDGLPLFDDLRRDVVLEDELHADVLADLSEDGREEIDRVVTGIWFEKIDHEAERITVKLLTMIDEGRCPRCGEPADRPPTPFPGDDRPRDERRRVPPAGSRITECRCVPVCSDCGTIEGLSAVFAKDPSRYSTIHWPLNTKGVETEAEQLGVRFEQAGVLDIESDTVITDEGVGPIERQRTGGWAEFGYDDTQDRDERSR